MAEGEQSKPRRMTRQRRVILEELAGTASHPTVEDVYERVRLRIPHISLGTVYRNLEVLRIEGLIQALPLAGRPVRFDRNAASHAHLRCLRCGQVVDVEQALPELRRVLQAPDGWQVMGERLEFEGHCPSCRSAGDA